jgi:hypothetical protein
VAARPEEKVPVMPAQPPSPNDPLPPLPRWEQTPAELPAAIRQLKSALRARIAASGRTVEEVFGVVERQVTAEVGEITAARDRGVAVWPVISYADIEAGTVPASMSARLPGRARALRPRAGPGLGP